MESGIVTEVNSLHLNALMMMVITVLGMVLFPDFEGAEAEKLGHLPVHQHSIDANEVRVLRDVNHFRIWNQANGFPLKEKTDLGILIEEKRHLSKAPSPMNLTE